MGDMFQRIIDEIFKILPNVFGLADDIFVVGYEADGKDHDKHYEEYYRFAEEVNLKLNKGKCHFRCTSVPCLVKSYPNAE